MLTFALRACLGTTLWEFPVQNHCAGAGLSHAWPFFGWAPVRTLQNLDSVSNILCLSLTGTSCLKCGFPESHLRDPDSVVLGEGPRNVNF